MKVIGAQPSFLVWPIPGSIVWVSIIFGYRHLGIVSDRFHDGKPMVISNSARTGGVHEEPWDDFAQGKPVTIDRDRPGIAGLSAVARARSRIGTAYDPLTWNCEHLVGFARGLTPASPQVLATVVIASLGLALLARMRA